MMTPEQRYLFDVTGYLHLKNALSDEELKAAQEAANEYIRTPTEELPPGFDSSNKNLPNGFAFAKPLEALTMHRSTWPIIKELTRNKPLANERVSLPVRRVVRTTLRGDFHCHWE